MTPVFVKYPTRSVVEKFLESSWGIKKRLARPKSQDSSYGRKNGNEPNGREGMRSGGYLRETRACGESWGENWKKGWWGGSHIRGGRGGQTGIRSPGSRFSPCSASRLLVGECETLSYKANAGASSTSLFARSFVRCCNYRRSPSLGSSSARSISTLLLTCFPILLPSSLGMLVSFGLGSGVLGDLACLHTVSR